MVYPIVSFAESNSMVLDQTMQEPYFITVDLLQAAKLYKVEAEIFSDPRLKKCAEALELFDSHWKAVESTSMKIKIVRLHQTENICQIQDIR